MLFHGEWTGPPTDAAAALTVGDRTGRGVAAIALEQDWLSLCARGRTCDIPIGVSFEYRSTSSVATPAPKGSIAIHWRLEARLEDFGRNATIAEPLQLVEVG